MKRLKIMLLSMAVLAVIGGALAFKAKYSQTYCTITATPVPGGTYTWDPFNPTKADCVQQLNVTTTTAGAAIKNPVFFTTKPANIACDQLTCTTFTYTKSDLQ